MDSSVGKQYLVHVTFQPCIKRGQWPQHIFQKHSGIKYVMPEQKNLYNKAMETANRYGMMTAI